VANNPALSNLDFPGFAPIRAATSEVVKGAPVFIAN